MLRSTRGFAWRGSSALWLIALPGILYFAVFRYVPLLGNVIAFQDYSIFLGVLLIGLISNAMVIMNINPYARDVVIGLIIVATVAVGSLTSSRE